MKHTDCCDRGSNYVLKEICANLDAVGTVIREEPIEDPGETGIVERYHETLRSAYMKVRGDLERVEMDTECFKIVVLGVK